LKEEKVVREKMRLLEKELETVTEKLESMSKDLKGMEDLKHEIKGLKLFLGRIHPEFKTKFPEIMQKVYKRK
jgi:hypothetical protein